MVGSNKHFFFVENKGGLLLGIMVGNNNNIKPIMPYSRRNIKTNLSVINKLRKFVFSSGGHTLNFAVNSDNSSEFTWM